MGNAFEISEEDVAIVMAQHGHLISDEYAYTLFDNYVSNEADVVEKSALAGGDMDEQTNYAHAEIATILKEAGILT